MEPTPEDWKGARNEAEWLQIMRGVLLGYLEAKGTDHGGVATQPGCSLVPYLSIWAVWVPGKLRVPGWWALAGDFPTTFIAAAGVPTARDAMAVFSREFRELARCLLQDEPHPQIAPGDPEEKHYMGSLLLRRAEMLGEFAEDERFWAQQGAKGPS